jgi:hypothetical protein
MILYRAKPTEFHPWHLYRDCKSLERVKPDRVEIVDNGMTAAPPERETCVLCRDRRVRESRTS